MMEVLNLPSSLSAKFINVYIYVLVRRVSQRFGFREVGDDEDWNLYWTDLSVTIERVVAMKKWQAS